MIKASPYVLKNMSAMLDQVASLEGDVEIEKHELSCDLSDISGLFNKFSLRYKNDEELQGICDEFENYLKNRDTELMDRITKELEELVYIRKLERLVMELREIKEYEKPLNMT